MSARSLLACCLLATAAAVALHSAGAHTAGTTQGRVGLNGACSNNSNCTATVPHSQCRDNICVCEDDYETAGSTCTIKLNSTCNDNTKKCNRTNAECVGGKCVCKYGYNMTTDGMNCEKRKAVYVYEPCLDNAQCSDVSGTSCYYGICFCNSNLFVNSDFSSCVVRTCTTSCSQMGHAECVQNTCRCQSNTLQDGNACYKKIGTVGDTCNIANLEICYLEKDGSYQNVSCTGGVCTCNSGHTASKDKKSCNGASAAAASTLALLLAAAASLRAQR